MKRLSVFLMIFVGVFALAGCDYLDDDLVNRIQDYQDEYCTENPDHEYCNLDYDAEIEKAEMKFENYFVDYSNAEYTTQDIADMYFDGVIPEGFEEERNADLESGTMLSLLEIDFRLDGAFDVSYEATLGNDKVVRKRPGRIKYDAAENSSSIEWLDETIDEDCDGVCENVDDTKTSIMKYFDDYVNSEITNQEIADMYYGGVLSDEFAMQRDKDLEDGVMFTLVSVTERNDSFFDIEYQEQRGNDITVRKRPGRTKYNNISLIIIWNDEVCDVVDDDCN